MNSLLVYLLQSSISLVVYYLAYELLFRKEAYFQFIRYYFLFAIITSAILPMMNIDINQLIAINYNIPIIIYPIPTLVEYTLSEVTIYSNPAISTEVVWFNQLSLPVLFLSIYIIGVVFSLFIFLFKLAQLSALLSRYWVCRINDSNIIDIPDSPTFSFFRFIFIDKNKLSGESEEKIIAHETVHIEQKHTIDLIIVELFAIILWFNPLVYMIKKKIKENHEFIADRDVIGLYSDKFEYSSLLIENSSIIKTNILTHNFSYSLLKRRLFMIKKTRNPLLSSLKLIGVAFAVSLVFFACSGPTSDDDILAKQSENKTVETESRTNDSDVFTVVDEMPQYNGGKEELIAFLSKSIKYPAAAKEKGIQGKVVVNFVIEKDGSVANTEVVRSVGGGCDEEAIRVVSSMPNWIPGKQNGKTVKVSYNLPINFVIDDKEEDQVFTVVEDMPEFPGGRKALLSYLANNINYPEEAKKAKVSGRVFVSFVIEKDGSVNDVKLLRGIGSGCDKESIRVVSSMPNWTPGTQKGAPVRVQYNLPIKFALQ